MTDEECFDAIDEFEWHRVRVTASDYVYDGWLVACGYKKKSRRVRVVVEDDNGRWFIHNPGQLEVIDATAN